jgi:hypothetical protein
MSSTLYRLIVNFEVDILKKYIYLVLFIVFASMLAVGCTGSSNQDYEWKTNKLKHATILASDFKMVSDASGSGDFKTLATYGQRITDDTQKAITENDQFLVSPKLQEAQKEWGLAMQDYNSAGKLMVKAGNEALANTDATTDIKQYTEYLKSGSNHADRSNALSEAAQ